MKNLIKLSALLLLVSSSLFAAVPSTASNDQITVQSSKKDLVINLSIQKESAGKSYVTFYDADSNEIMTDYLPGKISVNRGYNLSNLKYGTYTIAVTSNNRVVKKQVNVFEEYGKKAYIFLQ